MKRLLYISSVFLFALAFSSCTKDEVEAPVEQADPQLIKLEPIENSSSGDVLSTPQEGSTGPLSINDDGDDEDEGIEPDTDGDDGE